MLMVQVNGDAAVAVGSQVDTASPLGLLAKAWAWAKDDPEPPAGPQQSSGTAAGRDSRVDAEATREDEGNGRPRVKPRGELNAYEAKFRDRKLYKTGVGMQPGNRFDARTAKPRPDMATAYTETVQDAGGRLQQTVSAARMNFKRGDGSFADIDPSLREDRGRYRQKANSLDIDVAKRADDPSLTRLGIDGSHAVSAGMQDATASPAVVTGQKVTYAGAFPSVDVELFSLEDGIKETFILKGPDAPTRFVFPLGLTGLTARLTEAGVVEFVDEAGEVRAVTPRGFMVDSKIDPASGDGAFSDAVRYRLLSRESGPALEVTLDGEWLRDPARKFPVLVDPTYTRTVSGDTYADKYTPAANRATEKSMAMGTYDNGTHLARTYFKFNVALNPPLGQHTTEAYLNVFLSYQGNCGSYPFDVHAIRQDWSPTTLTWNNPPSLSGAIGSATPAPGAACANSANNPEIGTWVQVPLLRSIFDAWGSGNYGLALKAPTNTGTTSWKRFSSIETTKKPYLTITYAPNVGPQVDGLYPEPGASVYSLRPELMAAAHDPDTFPQVELQYRFQIYDGYLLIADSGELPWGQRSWIPPPGLLVWNKIYGWTAAVTDGELQSPPAAPSYFTPTVAQPRVTSTLGQNNDQGFDPHIANYTTSDTDAQVSTHGPPLAVARSYNSRDPRVSGAFGAGWSSLYDLKVREDRDAAGTLTGLVITYPEGVEVGFGRNHDGSWAPPLGRFATLTSSPAGTTPEANNPTSYRLVDKNGVAYVFDQHLNAGAAGTEKVFGIKTITDPRGFVESFEYTGSLITTVRSASNRTLRFLWQPAGVGGAKAPHILTVSTDPADPANPATAQVWTYAYTGDRLSSVCPPGGQGGCTTYSYTDGSGYSTIVLDSGPRTYLRLREPSPRQLPGGRLGVSDEVINNQGAFTGIVSGVELGAVSGPLQSANATAARFDGNDEITVPADVADNASAQSIALWFKTTTPGGVLYGFHSAAGMPGTVGAATYSPALYIGDDGRLRGQFYSGGPSVPITTAAPVTDNAWHFAVLSVNAGTQRLYLDGAEVGFVTNQPAQAIERASATIGAGYLGGVWPSQPHYSASNYTGYLHRFTGQIAEVADFTSALTAGEVANMHAAATRTTPLLDQLTTPEDRIRGSINYDAGAATVRSVTDANGGTWELLAPTITGSSVGYRTSVILSSPAAYWRLADQGGVQANDDYSFNYGDYDNVTLGALGPFGTGDVSAASFNGTTSQMRSPVELTAGGNTNMAISMWFQTANAAPGRVLYGMSVDPVTAGTPAPNGGFVPVLYIGDGGKLNGMFWNGQLPNNRTDPIVSPASVADNAWHHVVITTSGGTQTLYLDGQKIGERVGASALAGYVNQTVGAGYAGWRYANNPYYSATTAIGTPTFFDGQLAEVAVYRSGLGADQVSAQWEAHRDAAADAPAKYVGVKHPTGEITTNVYDPRHYDRLTRVINTLGYRTDYDYDEAGYTLRVTDANSNYTVTGHDARGNVSSYTSCQDRTPTETDRIDCSTEYFRYFLAANTLTDPRNDRITQRKDGRTGNAVDDNRFLTSYTYTAAGDLATVTTPPVAGHPNGRTTTTAYVAPNTASPSPAGGIQPAGLVASTTTPGGAVQRFVYYSNGDLYETISPLGGVTRFTYDGLGRVTATTVLTESQPDPLVTTFTYDARDQVTTETAPAVLNTVTGITHQARTSYIYDGDGNITAEATADVGPAPAGDKDPTRTLEWTYNDAGRVETFTDARAKTTNFDYNAYGQKIRETAPDGQVMEFTYDSEGRSWRTILKNYTGHPDNPTPAVDLVLDSRAYDPAGRLARVVDAMGFTTEHTYYDNNLPADLIRRDTVTPACLAPEPSPSCSFLVESNVYDPASNLISRTINNGKTTTRFSVDAADRVEQETLELGTNTTNDASDRTVTYTYNADDHITTTRTAQGAMISEVIDATYDGAGNLTEQIVQVGTGTRRTVWDRDDRGLVTTMTDPKGGQTSYIHDAAGNQAEIRAPQVAIEPGDGTSAPGRPTTSFGYNTFGEATHTRDPNGHISRTGYDPAGNLTTTTAAPYTPTGGSEINAVTTREYNDIGQITRERDPLGHDTTYRYDQLGHLVRVTAPGNAVTRFTHTLNGDLLSTTTPTGAVSESTYDFLARKLTDTAKLREPAQTHVTTYRYGPGGWLAKQISPAATAAGCTTPCAAGEVTSYTYDNAGQVTTITDPTGGQSTLIYDLKDRLLTRTSADGTSTTRTYNAAGDLTGTAEKNPDGTVLRSTSASYDANGWLSAVTDARGHQTTFTRDASGLITEQVEPIGPGTTITSAFGYDAAGNRTRFTDGRGNAFLTTYTSWNLPATRVEPATPAHPNLADRTWSWVYDANARPVRALAPGGVERTRTFDDRGNLTQETGSGAEAPTTTRTFGYDLDDRLTATSAPGASNIFTWDDRNQLRTTTRPADATTGGSGQASFDYDADGQMTRRTDAAGTNTYTYANGRLDTLTDAATGTTRNYTYTPDSQVASISYSSGPLRVYTYDDLQRLRTDTTTGAGGTQTAKIVYTFDDNDNLESKTTTGLAGPASNTYTYDHANRLTSWDTGTGAPGALTAYAYDPAGNRTQIGDQTLVYDQRNRVTSQTSPARTTTYTYTPRGTRDDTTVATAAAGSAPASTVTTGSDFDAFDQRVTDADTVYAYDALGRVVTTGPSAGPLTTLSYTGLTNDIASDGTTTYARDPAGDLTGIAQAAAGSGSAPGTGVLALTDIHDDVVAALNPTTGAVAGSTGYDPLGNVTGRTGTQPGRLGYQSEFTDPATGAVNMLSRWYDPGSGQFTSRDALIVDPVPVAAAGNGYGYLDANPLAGTDPTGHCCGISMPKLSLPSIPNPIPAIISTVSAVYTHVIKPVVNTTVSVVKKTTKKIISGAQKVGSTAKDLADKAAAEAAAAAQRIADELAEAKERAKAAAAKAKRELEKAAERARKEAVRMAKVIKRAEREARELAERMANYGVAISEKAAAGISASVGATVAAANATARFVDTHKATLAGIAVGVAVGLACAPSAAATLGATTVGCLAAAGAAGSATTAAISTPPTSWANAAHILEETFVGAGVSVATLGAGKILAPIASRAFAPALTRLGLTPATQTAAAVTNSVVPRAATSADDAARAAAGRTTQRPIPAGCNSFIPATPVLLADGTTKAIEDIKTGDLVLAADPADPRQAEPATQRVAATILGTGLKDLVDITIDTQTITATAGHPFWVTDDGQSLSGRHDGRWVDAGDLQPGDRLLEPDGDTRTIDHVRTRTALTRVHNLTISGVHTYYVLAGSDPVLVHNANGCPLYKTRDLDEQGRRITNAPAAPNWQTDELAAYLGYSPTGKVYGGQEAYKRGNSYIIQDTSSHKGGFWKMADDPEKFRSRGSRLRQGTYDFLLNPVGK